METETINTILTEYAAGIPLLVQAAIVVLMATGTLLMVVAGIGILRMPDLYLRMSATTKAATLGIGFILGSAALYFYAVDQQIQANGQALSIDLNLAGISARALAVIVFVFLTAPIGAHMIGRAGYLANDVEFWEGTVEDELEGFYDIVSYRQRHARTEEEST